MPTELGRKYQLDWRGDPPHMLKPDVPVWYRFLEKWGFGFQSLWYDCALGGPWLSAEDLRDPMKVMWRANLVKRADAVAELEDAVWIIEVASFPGLRAIGQILTYMSLWQEDPKIDKIERGILVCSGLDTDLIASAAKYGIRVFYLPGPPT